MAVALSLSAGVASFVGCGGGGHGGSSFFASSATAPSTSSSTSTTTTSTTSVSTTGVAVTSSSSSSSIAARTKTAVVVARSSDGKGFLETDQNGARIVHVKGTPRERGVQYGELVGDLIFDNLQAMAALAQTQTKLIPANVAAALTPFLTIAGAQIYKPYFPQETLDMIDGICVGAGNRTPAVSLRPDDLIFINAIIDAGATVQAPIFKCSGLAVWGPLSKNGKMFQLRNVDLFVGSGLESSHLFTVEKPDQGYSFVNCGWAGMLGLASGMNEHGVGISQVWAFSRDTWFGQPWILTNRRIMMGSINVDSIQSTYASTTRTYGSNFVFADRGDGRGGVRRAIALESTHANLAVFGDNDPREDATWGTVSLPIRMPFAVMRGDQAMCQAIHQRHYHIDPNDLTTDPRDRGGYKLRYKQQADMVAAYHAQGVLVGEPEMETISRQIAMTSDSLQCGVYENDDLVVHVANSEVAGGATTPACQRPFTRCDLDYYLPTLAAVVDRGTFSVGDTIQITATVGNDGRARKLDARAWLEVGGASVPLTTLAGIEAITGQTKQAVAKLVVPSGVASGLGRIVVELDEAGSHDVVDYTTIAVSVK